MASTRGRGARRPQGGQSRADKSREGATAFIETMHLLPDTSLSMVQGACRALLDQRAVNRTLYTQGPGTPAGTIPAGQGAQSQGQPMAARGVKGVRGRGGAVRVTVGGVRGGKSKAAPGTLPGGPKAKKVSTEGDKAAPEPTGDIHMDEADVFVDPPVDKATGRKPKTYNWSPSGYEIMSRIDAQLHVLSDEKAASTAGLTANHVSEFSERVTVLNRLTDSLKLRSATVKKLYIELGRLQTGSSIHSRKTAEVKAKQACNFKLVTDLKAAQAAIRKVTEGIPILGDAVMVIRHRDPVTKDIILDAEARTYADWAIASKKPQKVVEAGNA